MPRVLFIHHSVGRMILAQNVKPSLARQGIDLFDVDYNRIGTHDGSCRRIDAPPFPGDKTNPEDFASLFQSETRENKEYVKWMQGFDAVVVKSCFIALDMKSESLFYLRRKSIGEVAKSLASLFPNAMMLTPPPLCKITSDTVPIYYQQQLLEAYHDAANKGVMICDINRTLTRGEGLPLAKEFQQFWPFNSHPNKAGCAAAAQTLINGISSLIQGGK